MPAEKSGQAYKFAKPFRGPYRVEKTYENGADVRMVEKPGDKPIRVAFNRLRHCPKSCPDHLRQRSHLPSQIMA